MSSTAPIAVAATHRTGGAPAAAAAPLARTGLHRTAGSNVPDVAVAREEGRRRPRCDGSVEATEVASRQWPVLLHLLQSGRGQVSQSPGGAA